MGSAERMKAVAQLVNYPGKKIVVLSAMSGTTDQLVKITKALFDQSISEATRLIKELELKYKDTIEKLFVCREFKEKGRSLSQNILVSCIHIHRINLHIRRKKLSWPKGN